MASRCSWLVVVVCSGLVLLASASGAFAQAVPDPEYDTDDLVARGLFDAGRAAYDAGNYREALNYFQQAYEHSKRPRLLYNIGQSADRLRMDRTALITFRKYLELMPDADNRREVENRIRALIPLVADEPFSAPSTEPAQPSEQVASIAQPTPAPVDVAERAPQNDDASGSNVAPWLVVGAGGAAAITGIVLFAIGTSKINNVEDAPLMSAWSSVRDDADSGPAYRDAGLVVLTLGLVGAAAGLVWAVASNNDETATVSLGPSGVLVRGTL